MQHTLNRSNTSITDQNQECNISVTEDQIN